MRVHHHAGLAEGPAQDHVRGLATDAMELQQLLHRPGHDTPELLVQRPRHLHDRPRLLPVEARRADEAFELGQIRGGEIGGGSIAGEQRRGDLVHLGVGALGGEDRRYEQLQGIAVLERQTGDRVALTEDRGDPGGAPPRAGKRLTGGKLDCGLRRHRRARIRRTARPLLPGTQPPNGWARDSLRGNPTCRETRSRLLLGTLQF